MCSPIFLCHKPNALLEYIAMEYAKSVPVKRKRVDEKKTSQSRIYIKDDVSDEEDSDPPQWWHFWRESDEPPEVPLSDYTRPSMWRGQAGAYILILVGIGAFVLIVNHYNAKQLERIKEEFGLEPTSVEPEQWWQHALLHNVIVRSFKDSNNDGVGDLKGLFSQITCM